MKDIGESYEILGINTDDGNLISVEDLKKLYREKLFKSHPDKGGTSDEFNKIKNAYETILNHRLNSITRLKVNEKYKEVMVSLEDMYNGKSYEISVIDREVCENIDMCPECDGLKIKYTMLSMVGQCDSCDGTGFVCNTGCSICNGTTIVEKVRKYEVNLEPGFENNTSVNLNNHKIVFVLKKHPRLKRKGTFLTMEHNVSIQEVMYGFEIRYKHLDGKCYSLRSNLDKKIKTTYTIKDMGMRIKKSDKVIYGDLIVGIIIDFPVPREMIKRDKIEKIYNEEYKKVII